ncbi:Predicted SnoaL-like aldol condensation-catalyzing enzyme [Alteromonadaceae bacterium Bs31]|nr:Predicted SnoaL-like aldol condensation-catalyzing enzyme [Alteromonadaceae bacterium Bs31]
MTAERKNKIRAMLKGIETGEPESVAVVNPDKYIQHNPQTHEGREGLAALFKRLSQTSPRVNVVRIFSDGDFVFGHTEYDFSTSRVGFEVFRFEGEYTVEHWDNIQSRRGPNPAGHSMVDGSVKVTDLPKTEENRALVTEFVDSVLIGRDMARLPRFVSATYLEHNPQFSDGLASLQAALAAQHDDGNSALCYVKRHRILAEGNFVLSVCEGFRHGAHTSFYDLYRVECGIIVEHWDTTESVPPPSEWKNDNGKF